MALSFHRVTPGLAVARKLAILWVRQRAIVVVRPRRCCRTSGATLISVACGKGIVKAKNSFSPVPTLPNTIYLDLSMIQMYYPWTTTGNPPVETLKNCFWRGRYKRPQHNHGYPTVDPFGLEARPLDWERIAEIQDAEYAAPRQQCMAGLTLESFSSPPPTH